MNQHAGLSFGPLRRPAVETAAQRLMERAGIDTPRAFTQLAARGGNVLDELMAEVTIGESYFFREPAQFDLLRATVLPDFRRRRIGDRKFRAWSAGCSTGEEPYSVAIALREDGIRAHVVGTDISRARLAAARRGEYRRWSFRGVPDTVIDRYFARAGDSYRLAPAIRSEVEFRYLNLAADAFPAMSSGVWGMDLILCRNVLIYFHARAIARVAAQLLATLADDGWLLLGAADPPLGDLVPCEMVHTDAGVAYRREHTSRGLVRPAAPRPERPRLSGAAPAQSTGETGHRVADREALRESEPARSARSARTEPVVRSGGVSTPDVGSPAMEAYRRRDYEETIAIVSEIGGSGTASADDLILHIRSLANLGRLDDAGRMCSLALDRHRGNAEVHYLHAILVAESGSIAEGARAAKRALYLDRTMIVAQMALGSSLVRAGDLAGARRAFQAAERLLAAMASDAVVPYSDGEPARRMLEMARLQLKLAAAAAATATVSASVTGSRE